MIYRLQAALSPLPPSGLALSWICYLQLLYNPIDRLAALHLRRFVSKGIVALSCPLGTGPP